MGKHYLAINHESYDSTLVFGVFDTFMQARDHLEAETAKPGASTAARLAEIHEYDGAHMTAAHQRDWDNPTLWHEQRYAHTEQATDPA